MEKILIEVRGGVVNVVNLHKEGYNAIKRILAGYGYYPIEGTSMFLPCPGSHPPKTEYYWRAIVPVDHSGNPTSALSAVSYDHISVWEDASEWPDVVPIYGIYRTKEDVSEHIADVVDLQSAVNLVNILNS